MLYASNPDSIAPGLTSRGFGGVNAQAAMVPGGLIDGVSSLSQALLQAPIQRRQMALRERNAQREDELRQAQIANYASEASFRDKQSVNEGVRYNDERTWREDALKEKGREADQNNQRKGMEDLGTGIKNAWTLANQSMGTFLKGSGTKGGAPTRQTANDPYKVVMELGPDGRMHGRKILKTKEDITAERETRAGLAGSAPPAPVQAPAPMRGGIPIPADDPASDLSPAAPSAPAPDLDPAKVRAAVGGAPAGPAPSGKAVRLSVMQGMVGPGRQFPDMDTAIASARAQGHAIIQDQ